MRSHLWFVLLKINVSVSVCVCMFMDILALASDPTFIGIALNGPNIVESHLLKVKHIWLELESRIFAISLLLCLWLWPWYIWLLWPSLSLLIFWIHSDRKRLPIKRNSESGTINEYVKRFIAYGICRRYCYTQLPTYTNVHVLMFTQYVFVYIACVCVCVYGLMSHH